MAVTNQPGASKGPSMRRRVFTGLIVAAILIFGAWGMIYYHKVGRENDVLLRGQIYRDLKSLVQQLEAQIATMPPGTRKDEAEKALSGARVELQRVIKEMQEAGDKQAPQP